jgi:hypothetical protein
VSGIGSYFFFVFFAGRSTLTVTVLIALPPEVTVTIALSLANLESSARPVESSLRVSVFFVPAESVTPPDATTTSFVVVRTFLCLSAAVIAVIFRPFRCSLTLAFRLARGGLRPAGARCLLRSLLAPHVLSPRMRSV